MKKYKCMNIGNCEYANTGKPFEIAEGEELKCPNGCDGSMLVEVKSGPNLKVIVGGIAVAALLGGGAYFAFSGGGEEGSITLNKTTASVFEGDVDTLKAIVKPEDAGYTLRWTSNNPDVATVDNGVVTFHTSGEVKIGVQVNENRKSFKSILCGFC